MEHALGDAAEQGAADGAAAVGADHDQIRAKLLGLGTDLLGGLADAEHAVELDLAPCERGQRGVELLCASAALFDAASAVGRYSPSSAMSTASE